VNTFGPGDVIEGGAGVDTLVITALDDEENFGDGFGAAATVNDVEILMVVEATENASWWYFDVSGFSGLDHIIFEGHDGTGASFYNLQEELQSLTIDGSDSDGYIGAGLWNVDSIYQGDDDTLVVNVIDVGTESSSAQVWAATSDDDEVIEHYSIVVSGSDNYLSVWQSSSGDHVARSLTFANAVGNSGAITANTVYADVLETVDASAMTGDFTFDFTASTGGVQDEQEVAVSSGTGDDNIILSDGMFTVVTGAGDDRVSLGAFEDDDDDTDDVLDGGDGTDTLAADVSLWADADMADLDVSNFEGAELTGAAAAAATVDLDGWDAVTVSSNLGTGGFGVTIENAAVVTFTENAQGNTLTFDGVDELALTFADGESGTVNNLVVADIDDVTVQTASAGDDITFSNINISGVETLTLAGAGNITFSGGFGGMTDDGSLQTLDLSDMTGAFTNDAAAIDGSTLDELVVGNLENSQVEFDDGSFSGTVTFGTELDNTFTLQGAALGVGGAVLDLSALGVDGFADLDVVFDDGGDGGNNGNESLTITSSAFDGEIVLLGTYNAIGDLDGAANFVFA